MKQLGDRGFDTLPGIVNWKLYTSSDVITYPSIMCITSSFCQQNDDVIDGKV